MAQLGDDPQGYSRVKHPRRSREERENAASSVSGSGTSTNYGQGGGSSGGGSSGGGSGGGGGASSTKSYIHYYTRILNIKPNMALVQKAAKGNYTMQEFQLLVQREDTNRFLKTWQGQQVAENFRTMWARIFPSLGSQPGLKSLRLFLKQEPSKDYRTVTNPTSMRAMYAFLSKTKLFQKIYPEFAKTEFARTLNFAGYRKYKDEFRNIYRQYTGRLAADDEISYFFRSRIAPGEFEKNLQTMSTGAESYTYATGAPVQADTQKRALYGRRGSAQTLAKVAAAYNAREQYMKTRPGDFSFERESDTNRIVQRTAY